ncbi:MAG: hypothetical protein GY860_21750 [Desulfobacteraceae bacterium]|nr:hypothetical protein [Desulfobacteraceae bacterium]
MDEIVQKNLLIEDVMASISDVLKKSIIFNSLEEEYLKENLSKLPIFSGLEDNEMNRFVSSIRSQL